MSEQHESVNPEDITPNIKASKALLDAKAAFEESEKQGQINNKDVKRLIKKIDKMPDKEPEKKVKQRKPATTANPLTDEEKEYIRKNFEKPGENDESIAKTLGRHPLTVQKYRKSLNIQKPGQGIQKKNDEEFKTKLGSASTLDEKRSLFRTHLLASPRINRIRAMFKENDLQYFIDRWVEYHLQFKDMTATEEDLLEKMIVLDIRLNYNQKFLFDLHTMTDAMKMRLSSDELNPEDEKDLVIIQTIQTYNTQEVELNKQYQLLLKEYQAIQQSLNATREQREANQKIGALTFLDIVRKMNDEETKIKMGRTTELTKIAAERKRTELEKPHKFIDGTVDIPILNAETFKAATQDNKSE